MNISSVRQSLTAFTVLTLVLGLFASTAALAAAQDTLIPEGAPVDIHSGTCDDYLTEPAYDAGDISQTTSDDVWDDAQLQVGMLVDENAGISGVDLNNDQTLQSNETVLVNGETEPVGKAQADFDASVDTSEPYVVVVHAGPDTYETALACGSLYNAQNIENDADDLVNDVDVTDDDGDLVGGTLTMLDPMGDSQLFGYAVLGNGGQQLTTYLFQPNPDAAASAAPAASAAALAPEGYPIDAHTGTCADWTTEPAYDIGDMQKTNVAAEGEQEAGTTEGDVPAGAEYLGDVYRVDVDTDFDANELINDQPYVIAVHESADNYDKLIACGQVLPIVDRDETFVILKPVGDSNQTGFVKLGQDEGHAMGLLWNCEPQEARAPEASPTPMPTQEPTPTPVGTAVIVQTEVSTEVVTEIATAVTTETEVVPAPTATAMAEGTPNATP